MKLIENWQGSYRFLSMQAAAVGAILYSLIQTVEEAKLLGIKIPEQIDDLVAYATLLSIIIARLIKQDIPTQNLTKDKENG